MNFPADRQLYHGEIASHWLDDGILISVATNLKHTIENTTLNQALIKRITLGKRIPLLFYLRPCPMPDRATRKYVAAELPYVYTAIAIVSTPALASCIMSLYFSGQNAPIPVRHFTDDWAAKAWLRAFILETPYNKFELSGLAISANRL